MYHWNPPINQSLDTKSANSLFSIHIVIWTKWTTWIFSLFCYNFFFQNIKKTMCMVVWYNNFCVNASITFKSYNIFPPLFSDRFKLFFSSSHATTLLRWKQNETIFSNSIDTESKYNARKYINTMLVDTSFLISTHLHLHLHYKTIENTQKHKTLTNKFIVTSL